MGEALGGWVQLQADLVQPVVEGLQGGVGAHGTGHLCPTSTKGYQAGCGTGEVGVAVAGTDALLW
jgi:hypothetical protein